MIYHILRGTVLHTTPTVIRIILDNAEKVSRQTSSQHFMCIAMFGEKMLYKNVDDNPYDKLFKEYGFKQYKLFYKEINYLKFVLTLSKKDTIIIHGNMNVKFHLLTNMLFLGLRKNLMRRTSLICWGNNDFVKGEKFKTRATLGLIREWSYGLYKNIITLSQGDKEEVQRLYPKANVVYLPYLSNWNELKLVEKDPTAKCRVMVSHSGWSENRHEVSFNLLSKYVPNVEVVCPLCYGDANYIENIIEKGRIIFGTDFKFFKDLMPLQEYTNLLRSMDVYMTAAERQTGLGAAYRAVEGGLKLYVTGNNLSSMRDEGYMVFDISDIKTQTLEDFRHPLSLDEMKANIRVLSETHSNGKMLLDGWRRVYED